MGSKPGIKKAPLPGAGQRSGEGIATILPFLATASSGLPSVLDPSVLPPAADGTHLYPSTPEEIAGPFHGYYFACYAVPEERGFRAYAKVCRRAPTDVWLDARASLKVAGPVCVDPAEALRKVVREARRRLGIGSDGSTIIRIIDQLLG